MNINRIYILGAGCSVNYGYPLAMNFRDALIEFGRTLDQQPYCERLKRCVVETFRLMEQFSSPTVDRLVLQIDEELLRRKKEVSSFDGLKHQELECEADSHILDAKIATAALILALESGARKTGLQGYRDWLNTIFEGERDAGILETTPVRILTFNYDRLFELAFAEHFRLDANLGLFRPLLLNSGIPFFPEQDWSIVPGRFCFLKLNGTAGVMVANRHEQRFYGSNANLLGTAGIIDDKRFWNGKSLQTPEPLICFPFEKDRARQGGTSFLYDDYVREIWEMAKQLATEADQIRVIGYSFAPNDRKGMLELLRCSNCQIVVQNRDAETARQISDELGFDHPELSPRLKPFGKPF